MFKNNLKTNSLDSYQAPLACVFKLQPEQTILADSITTDGFNPGFGFGDGGEIPIG